MKSDEKVNKNIIMALLALNRAIAAKNEKLSGALSRAPRALFFAFALGLLFQSFIDHVLMPSNLTSHLFVFIASLMTGVVVMWVLRPKV